MDENLTEFEKMKNDLLKYIKFKNLDENNIVYVNLDNEYWVPWNYFKNLNTVPKLWDWEYFEKDVFDDKWLLPKTFKIVFRDYSWIGYNQCFDPFYSSWEYHMPVKRSPNKYYEHKPYIPKYGKPLVLGDFIKSGIKEKSTTDKINE